jgi:hypothetical protein
MTVNDFTQAAGPFLAMQKNLSEMEAELIKMKLTKQQRTVLHQLKEHLAMSSYYLAALSSLEAQKQLESA